jgi:hypothetical protein
LRPGLQGSDDASVAEELPDLVSESGWMSPVYVFNEEEPNVEVLAGAECCEAYLSWEPPPPDNRAVGHLRLHLNVAVASRRWMRYEPAAVQA